MTRVEFFGLLSYATVQSPDSLHAMLEAHELAPRERDALLEEILMIRDAQVCGQAAAVVALMENAWEKYGSAIKAI